MIHRSDKQLCSLNSLKDGFNIITMTTILAISMGAYTRRGAGRTSGALKIGHSERKSVCSLSRMLKIEMK